MNRLKLNYFVDLALFIQFALVGYSGILLLLNGHGVSHLWRVIHEQLGILMLVFFVAHVILHWRWIVYTTKNLFRTGKEMKKGEVIEANYMPVD